MDAEERAWLSRYRAGDVEALSNLVERYRKPLFGYILSMTEGRGDPEGVFQDTWLRAIRNLRSFRDENLLGWLYRTARNLVIDQFRKNRFRGEMPGSDNPRNDSWPDRIQAPDPGPDREAAGRELGAAIRAAVQNLPPEQREVFLMRMQGGLSFRDIAAAQGVGVNTALGRMHYAVGKLRERLKGEYETWSGS